MATTQAKLTTEIEDPVYREIMTAFPKTTKVIGQVLKRIGHAASAQAWGALEAWMMEAFEELYRASMKLKERQATVEAPENRKLSDSAEKPLPKQASEEAVFFTAPLQPQDVS